MLADLKFAQPADQPGSQDHAEEQRREAGEGSPEGYESEQAKRPDYRKELLVEKVIQHGFWLDLVARQQPFHRLLNRHASRPLEKDSVAFARQPPHKISSRFGILKKVRGARQPRTHGLIDHVAGSAAYTNEHINPATRDVSSDFAV